MPDPYPPAPRFDLPNSLQLETGGITEGPRVTSRTTEASASQKEFWSAQTAHKNSVAAKLRTAGRPDLAKKLEHCHTKYTFTVCNDCGRTGQFPNRCDTFLCPECQPRLANERKEAVAWWALRITQPKHVVLTLRNQPEISAHHIKEVKRWFRNLRARRFADNWNGGFYALEVTNEGRGWHIHLHALVNARWIDAAELARQWDSVTNHNGHIVKVKDTRHTTFLQEVTKYVCKGSQLATWTPDQIRSFAEALTDQRTFGVFGSLYGARTEYAEWIKAIREHKPLCTCGSCNISYYDEAAWLARDLRPSPSQKPRPPDQDRGQGALFDMHVPPHQVGA